MGRIKDQYICHCTIPVPRLHKGEDTGLCSACSGVYDENLYERRLRQNVPGWNYADVDEYIAAKDRSYAALPR